ncbi:MAG: hypothetical protein AAF497_12345, partial [Planctomycetota bacterium]
GPGAGNGLSILNGTTTAPTSGTQTTEDYLYLTAWSDDAVAQGLVADITIDGVPMLSGNSMWQVLPTDNDLDNAASAPWLSEVRWELAAGLNSWEDITTGPQNSDTLYGLINEVSMISPSAEWMWYDSGAQTSANAPFQPGFDHDEYLIFRIPTGAGKHTVEVGYGDTVHELDFGNKGTSAIHGQKYLQRSHIGHRTGGIWDSYDTSNSEPNNPHPELGKYMSVIGAPTSTYDQTSINQHFIDTFHSLPDDLTWATLRIGLKPLTSGGVAQDNDTLSLFVTNGFTSLPGGWSTNIGDWLDIVNSTTNVAWNSTNYPSGAVLTVPVPASVLALMNTHDRLDVRVQDDTAVDFMDLCYGYTTLNPYNGVTIDLIDGHGNVVDIQVTHSMDGENGHYWFEKVPPGTYTVREELPGFPFFSYYWPVNPSSGEHHVSLHPGQQIEELDFVNAPLQAWYPCWGFRPIGAIGERFDFVAADYQQNFVDTYLVGDVGTIDFTGLSGELTADTFVDSHGVTLGNLSGRFQGVFREGVSPVEHVDGYDGSYNEDGDELFLIANNHLEPLTISFDNPVSSVGSFLLTGDEGTVEELQIQAFDGEGNLVGESTARVSLFDDSDGREGFFGISVPESVISTVSIQNLNQENFGNVLGIDNLQWSRSVDGGLSCDLNGDGICDTTDIDILTADIASGGGDLANDVNGDGVVDQADLPAWLADAGATNLPSGNSYLFGDANLDGVVDVSDFAIWNANKFTVDGVWSRGDFNADGVVDVPDFGVWNANKFTAADTAGDSVASRWLPFRRADDAKPDEVTPRSLDEVFSQLEEVV